MCSFKNVNVPLLYSLVNPTTHAKNVYTPFAIHFPYRIGMIEWVQNTKPLKDFMQSALTDDEKKNYT